MFFEERYRLLMNSPKYVEKIALRQQSTIEMSSPFRTAEIAFNWLNRDYPVYHDHSHWEILVIMSGEIGHNINGKKSVLKKGDVCLIKPNDKHSLKFKENYKGNYQHINFTFTNEFAQKVFSLYDCYEELLAEINPIQFSLDDSELTMVYDKSLLTQNLSQQKYEMNTKLIVTRILTTFFEQKMLFNSDYPNWLNEFLLYINNPNSFGKTVKELAENTSYSYSRLARLFKQYTGVTIVDYVNEKKMVYAKRLLRTTSLTTLQISEKIAYSSLSSFNHLFKTTYGMTPSEYRKEHRKKK